MQHQDYVPMNKEEKISLVVRGEAKFSKYIIGHPDYIEVIKRDIFGVKE